jgi:ribonuclease BN (tRNA processing enzyme)
VQVVLLPSATSPRLRGSQYLTSFLINDVVAIDAGALGVFATPARQTRIRHIFLTHTHVDHIATLPIFLINVLGLRDGDLTIHAPREVLDCLERDIFNGRVWPNFARLAAAGPPHLKLNVVRPGRTIHADDLEVTAVPVDHVIPTVGYIVKSREATVVFPSDTGPTEAIWHRARRESNWKATFLEATVPNALDELAQQVKHLTPRLFAEETRKVPPHVRLIAVHLHPRYHGRVAKELKALGLPNVEVARPGKRYVF